MVRPLKKSESQCFRKKLDSKRPEDREKAGGKKEETPEKTSASERFSCRLGAGLIPLASSFLRKKRCREITYSVAGRPRTWRRDELGISLSWQDVCDPRELCGQRVPIAVRPSTSHAPHIASNPSPAVGRMLSSVKSLSSLLSSFVILSLSCSKKLLTICLSLILLSVCNFQVCWSLVNVYMHRLSCEGCSAHICACACTVCFSSSAFCCLLVVHSRWSTWACFSFASQYPLSLLWKGNGS